MAQEFKPDQLLGESLEFSSPEELYKVTKEKIKSKKIIPEAYKNLLIALLDSAHAHKPFPDAKLWEAAEKTKSDKTKGITISAIESDFGEILGPFLLIEKNPKKYGIKPNKLWLKYPSAGNAQLYDYFLSGEMISAKASSASSNIIGLKELAENINFEELPDSLEKRMCKRVAKSSSTLYQPIDAIMFLIEENVSLPSIDKTKFKKGYQTGLKPNSKVSNSWAEIIAEDNVTSKYFTKGTVKPVIVSVGKISSASKNSIVVEKTSVPKDKKYSSADEISSKNDYTNLYIRTLGTDLEGTLITSYSGSSRKIELASPNKSLVKGSKIEIYTRNESLMTAKLISGICADELADLSDESKLDFTEVMSIFTPTIVKTKITNNSLSISINPKTKKVIRNKNHPTNPRGIVRGKLGIQP
jgi:hypothetical protein